MSSLIITGLTGTGKTSLAIKLARTFNLPLISADARQVYKQMDIGTGKYAKEENWEEKDQFVLLEGVPLYGVNLINPDRTFSAGQFVDYVKQVTNKIGKSIIVGGTGFYINALLRSPDHLVVKPNKVLRETLAQKEKSLTASDYIQYLQSELKILNSKRLDAMNNSDVNNPRRLIRAIEIAQASNKNEIISSTEKIESKEPVPVIFLDASKEFLAAKIEKRVKMMAEMGLQQEVKALINKYPWSAPGLQTIGYREWKEYFQGAKQLTNVYQEIVMHHLQYARKQRIYSRHISLTQTFDISRNSPLQAYYYCKHLLKKTTI